MNSWEVPQNPRKWQEKALEIWRENFSGVISVVTGGGKTLFSFFCIKEFKKTHTNGKIIIIVPTLTLLDQWYMSLVEDFSVSPEEIACFSSQERAKAWRQINIIVINTARKKLKMVHDKQNFFLIVDECHRAGSPINSEAIQGTYGATLGLSATPEREYDEGFNEYIVPSLGRIIYSYDYLEALRDGVITPFILNNIKVDLLPHEEREYNKITKKISIISQKQQRDDSINKAIQQLLMKRARISASAMMRIPTACKIAEDNLTKRVIIFHENISGANLICKILNKRHNSAVVYHSAIGPSIRRDNLRLYRKGIFNILVTCKALDEGMNAPETSVAIIASSTASTRQRIQRLGRVLRPAQNKTNAKIFTLYATEQEKEKLLTEFHKFQENIEVNWLKVSLNKNG